MRFTYLLIDFLSILVPFAFSFHPRIRFCRHFGSFFAANLISSLCFLAWDVAFTAKGIWGFNEQYTVGFRIFNLPLEEILFFISIPFACVFTYHWLTSFWKIKWNPSAENRFVLLFSFALFVIGMIYINRRYSSASFIGTAVLLLVFHYHFRAQWSAKFFTTYAVLLIPFFIVNGILTGTGLSQPVVWYDAAEISGLRLGTIPVEDIFYGMEMILLNLFFFEKFQTIQQTKIAHSHVA